MTTSEWRERWQGLARELGRADLVEEAALRGALARAWRVGVEAPTAVQDKVREVDAGSIGGEIAAAIDRLQGGEDPVPPGRGLRAEVTSLLVTLGALDRLLWERGERWPRSAERLASDGYHVIPRHSPRPVTQRIGPGAGFRRRAVIHHRIIPTVIGEAPVELHLVTGVTAPFDAETSVGGAALMPGLQLEPPPCRDWHAVDATCAGDAAMLTEQVEGAYGAEAFATAWPELSMPPDRRELMVSELRGRNAAFGPENPGIFAAGSWHEESDEGVVNRMRVYDRRGEHLLSYEKRSRYLRDDVSEGTVPGRTIPVLICPNAAVAFAVCLDFCELETDGFIYGELDVDLVVVASLGNPTTMKGHVANATKLRAASGARTLVVQQRDTAGGSVGMVLPASDGTNTDESLPWSTRLLR